MTTEIGNFRILAPGASGEAGEDTALTENIFKKIRQTFLCPICHKPLQDNPTALDVCGHVFCHECIVAAIGKSYLLVKDPWSEGEEFPTESDDHSQFKNTKKPLKGKTNVTGDEMKATTARSRKARNAKRRRLDQSCPICFVPVQISDLISVSLISNLVAEIMKHPLLSAALVAPEDGNGEVRQGYEGTEEQEVLPTPVTVFSTPLIPNDGFLRENLVGQSATPQARSSLVAEEDEERESGTNTSEVHHADRLLESLRHSSSTAAPLSVPSAIPSDVLEVGAGSDGTTALLASNLLFTAHSHRGSLGLVDVLDHEQPETTEDQNTGGISATPVSLVLRPKATDGESYSASVLRNFEELSSPCSDSASHQDLRPQCGLSNGISAVSSADSGGGATSVTPTTTCISLPLCQPVKYLSQKVCWDTNRVEGTVEKQETASPAVLSSCFTPTAPTVLRLQLLHEASGQRTKESGNGSSLSTSSSDSFCDDSSFHVRSRDSKNSVDLTLACASKGGPCGHESKEDDAETAVEQKPSSVEADVHYGNEMLKNLLKTGADDLGVRERSTSTISTTQLSEHREDISRLPYTLSVDTSVGNSLEINEILSSAAKMFGLRVLDERVGDSVRPFFAHNPKATGAGQYYFHLPSRYSAVGSMESQLFWKERHYSMISIMCTYCLVAHDGGRITYTDDNGSFNDSPNGEPTEAEGSLPPMTPSMACAIASDAVVTEFQWIVECVSAHCLLPALQYSRKFSQSSRGSVSSTVGGRVPPVGPVVRRWETEGRAFILLPDNVLQFLQNNVYRGSVRGPSYYTTGGFSFRCWRRLILLGGGVLLRFPEECMHQFLLDMVVMSYSDVMAEQNGSHQDERAVVVQNAMRMASEAGRGVLSVDCCPDGCGAGTFTVRDIIVLRNSLNTGKGTSWSGKQLLFKRRLERFLQLLRIFFSLMQSMERVHGCEFGASSDVKAPKSVVKFGVPGEELSAPKITLRSTRWLLRSFSECPEGGPRESSASSDRC